MADKVSVLGALVGIQSELKAPKDQNAGRYRYRNIEDINESVKPLAAKYGCAVVYSDEFTEDGRCIATCTLMGEDGQISANGVAYVQRQPKNMSIEQASGAASTYARKYAACGLFAIDNSENDHDAHPVHPSQPEKKHGRYDKIADYKQKCLDLGITEKGIKSWLDSHFGKPMGEFTDDEIRETEEYLASLIVDKRALNGEI